VDLPPSPSAPPPSASASALKGETTIEEPDRAARAIVRRTAETRATVPELELSVVVAADALLELAAGEQVSTSAMLVAACAAALRASPRVNGAYRDGRYELYSRVNIAVTLHTSPSPVTATVLDADVKSPAELDEELARLRERAASGELTPPEQAGATFTLTDLGAFGIHRAGALVTPTQAAALTAGAIRAVPVLREGTVVPGHVLVLSMACDHRIVFPALAASFLGRIAQRLEQPL
jgi:pyruvate dehydrogenase E2 component (dihydrolipoamide acetyltransferase)